MICLFFSAVDKKGSLVSGTLGMNRCVLPLTFSTKDGTLQTAMVMIGKLHRFTVVNPMINHPVYHIYQKWSV
jgi:hypothetical protein